MSKLSDVAFYVKDKIANEMLTSHNYIGVDNMLPNCEGIVDSEYVPTDGFSTQFQKGDILIGNIRPYFKKIWIADREGGCSPDVLVIRPKNINADYLYAYLATDAFFNYDMAGSKGSKMPRGDKNHIMNYPVAVLEQQVDIGNFIKGIKLKIANNNAIISELEAMAKILYDYWFLQFDFPDENGKPYKSSGGKMVWNEELKRKIPEGWKVDKVANICIFENGDRGKNYPSGNDFVAKGVPFVTGGMIEGNHIVYNSLKYITENKYKQLRAGKASVNDILFTLRGSLAKCIYSPFEKMAIASALVIVRPRDNISNRYLYHYLTSSYFKQLCSNYDNGSVQANLSIDVISAFYCCIPDKAIIKQWDSVIDNVDGKISLLLKENQELASLRDFLLPMLMNGQVTFKDEVKS